jgi:hypothetical protein
MQSTIVRSEPIVDFPQVLVCLVKVCEQIWLSCARFTYICLRLTNVG